MQSPTVENVVDVIYMSFPAELPIVGRVVYSGDHGSIIRKTDDTTDDRQYIIPICLSKFYIARHELPKAP